VETRYRGHATGLAAAALDGEFGLVLTLGGDGTVNEAVNGILGPAPPARYAVPEITVPEITVPEITVPETTVPETTVPETTGAVGHTARAGHAGEVNPGGLPGARLAARAGATGSLPAFAPLPGGNANVFTRALGLPADPVDAAGRILQALAEGRSRHVGLGLAGDRYFTFNAGLGLDAEVVRAVDGRRAEGRTATPALYVRMALHQFYRVTDRRHPALTLERAGHAPDGPVFVSIVSNTAPWSFLGRRPINPNPEASFDSGLDVFALRTLRSVGTVRAIGHTLTRTERPPGGRNVLTEHDLAEVTIRSNRPVAFQVDGEYMGERECVRFLSVPDALRVVA